MIVPVLVSKRVVAPLSFCRCWSCSLIADRTTPIVLPQNQPHFFPLYSNKSPKFCGQQYFLNFAAVLTLYLSTTIGDLPFQYFYFNKVPLFGGDQAKEAFRGSAPALIWSTRTSMLLSWLVINYLTIAKSFTSFSFDFQQSPAIFSGYRFPSQPNISNLRLTHLSPTTKTNLTFISGQSIPFRMCFVQVSKTELSLDSDLIAIVTHATKMRL